MKAEDTVETRYKFYKTNHDLYNEVLSETNDFLYPIIVKYMEKNLDITKPRYSAQFLPVPWPFDFSRFHCVNTTFNGDKKNSGSPTCGHSASAISLYSAHK